MSKASTSTDVAIIGAGPVGLFAVFECGMLDMSCVVIDALDHPGGQCTALYPEKPIYDIPGYPCIMAGDLVTRLLEQAAPFEPVYRLCDRVETLDRMGGGRWQLHTANGARIDARAVIIAAGVGAFEPKRLPFAGAERFEAMPPGRGVQYLVKRRDDYRGRRVVVAGGGDSAVDWALSLAEVAARVAVVHRRPKFRAAPESVRRLHDLAAAGAIDLVVPFQLQALDGTDERLDAVIVRDLDGNDRRIEADVLLPFYGLSMTLGPVLGWGLALDRDHIVVEPSTCETSRKGLFAIGDVASYPGKLKLILSGFAEAALAAHAIFPLVHPGEALHFEYSTTKGLPATTPAIPRPTS